MASAGILPSGLGTAVANLVILEGVQRTVLKMRRGIKA